MNKIFVTCYKICYGWRTNSPVSMDPPIVFCLRGMNISCWSHMLDLHRRKTFFLNYQNIILCLPGGPHDTSVLDWPTCQFRLGWIFLDETQNTAEKMRFEPATPWSSEAFSTRLLLRLCCCASYCFFVLCSRVLIRSSQHENRSRTCHLSGPTAQKWVKPTC
jgi:hypothetical protein